MFNTTPTSPFSSESVPSEAIAVLQGTSTRQFASDNERDNEALYLLLSVLPEIQFVDVLEFFRTYAAMGAFFDRNQKNARAAEQDLLDRFLSVLMDYGGLNDPRSWIQETLHQVDTQFWLVENGGTYRRTYVALLKSALAAGNLDFKVSIEQLVHLAGLPQETLSTACAWLVRRGRISMHLRRLGNCSRLRVQINAGCAFNR